MFFKKKVTNYRIVYSESPHKLAEEVRLWLKEGWILQGGISNSEGKTSGYQNGFKSDCVHYAQAMIKT